MLKPLLISTILSLLLASLACSRTDVERIREINESAEASPVSTLAPLPSPVPIATVAPLPSPVLVATVAPLPSPVPIVASVPLPSPVPIATVARLRSPVSIATVATLTSPVPIATVAPTPQAPVATVTSGQLSAEIQATEVARGDCINSTLPEGISITTVVIVVCSGPWEYRVLGLFEVDNLDKYPGEGYFERRAYEKCGRQYSYFLYPLQESWILGDRTVSCLQGSFGLSVVDPDKLDRLVGVNTVNVGECFSEAPETGGLLVELVNCSGPWEYRVLGLFEVDNLDKYPGEGYFERRAYEKCGRQYSYFFYPLQESWILGDRTVSCLQESFGLSIVDPDKLDRLVGVNTVNVGECFNEAPEMGWLLAELVNCSGPWEYRVLGLFKVDELGEYPGEGYFGTRAYEDCDRRYSYLLHPLQESWILGDRTVSCLQESFGLSVVDPDKLDRLVRVNTVNVGECFNEAPETGWLLVELVNCSDPWENQVVRTLIVPWNGEYPGTGYFEQQVRKECQGSDYYFEPSPTTWDQGDRVVVCAKANSP